MVGWHHWLNRHVWVNSRSGWWTRRPGVLRFMGSRRVRHNWATEQQQQLNHFVVHLILTQDGKSTAHQSFFFKVCVFCSLLKFYIGVCVLSHLSHVRLFLQARILEWGAVPSSRAPSQPRAQTGVSFGSYITGRFFTAEPQGIADQPCGVSFRCTGSWVRHEHIFPWLQQPKWPKDKHGPANI